jgi:hypothetical protein
MIVLWIGWRKLRRVSVGCHIRESDANVARTCRTRSAQQGMLLLDPSEHIVNCVFLLEHEFAPQINLIPVAILINII